MSFVITFFDQSILLIVLFPIYWLFIIALSALWFNKLNLKIISGLLAIAILYSFYLYPKTGLGKRIDYQEILLKDDDECQPNYNYTLSEFLFLNHQLDTIRITNLDKPVLVETWNETCPPCIQSIKEMEDKLTGNPHFDVMYLYQQRGKKRLTNAAIFNYKFITNKQHIYIDLNNDFSTYMNLHLMPYYLMYNQAGKLIGTRHGYKPEYKDTFTDELEKLIQIDIENCLSS